MIIITIDYRKQKKKNNSLVLSNIQSPKQKQKSEKLRLPSNSALLSLTDDEKRQVVSWLDLERNAPILQKTDQAIAAKLNAKTASLVLPGSAIRNIATSSRVKSAAQVSR